jgi:hypothetical protein
VLAAGGCWLQGPRGATNPGDVDLIVTRIVELAKDGVYDTEELSGRTLSSLNSAQQNRRV